VAEPVYVSVNLPNIITIALIIIVVWTLLAAGISMTRRYTGMGSSDQTMAAAA
jgi:hypothetical protein